MAVVHCKEVTNRDTSEDNLKRKRYTRTFQLLTDTGTDGARQVLAHPELPGYGDFWEEVSVGGVVTDIDTDAFCVDRRANQSDGENHQNWTVVCEYVGRGDPTLEPAEVSFGEEDFQETVQRDLDTVPKLVANSAGDPYEAGMTRDRKRGIITIVQNVLMFDPIEAGGYRNTLNLFPFLVGRYPPGFGPGTCKMDSLSAQAVWYADNSNIHYYRRTAKITTDPKGWAFEVLDAGFHEVVTIGGVQKRVKITLPDGTAPSVPQPLDGSGGRLPVGGSPVYNSFVRYEPVDWSGLNLEF